MVGTEFASTVTVTMFDVAEATVDGQVEPLN